MPTEIIKCTACGSTDVTEFKPDTFVCGHCEAVFKHVSLPGGGAAGCQVPSAQGTSCGVAAIGRCIDCGHAFFRASHKGRRFQVEYVDLCSECLPLRVKREAEDTKAQEDAKEAAETTSGAGMPSLTSVAPLSRRSR